MSSEFVGDTDKPRQGSCLPPVFARKHFGEHHHQWHTQKYQKGKPVNQDGRHPQNGSKELMSLPGIHDKFTGHGEGAGKAIDKDGDAENGAQQVKDVQILFAGKASFHDETDKQKEQDLKAKDEEKSHHENRHEGVPSAEHAQARAAIGGDLGLEGAWCCSILASSSPLFNDLKLLRAATVHSDGIGAKANLIRRGFEGEMVDKVALRLEAAAADVLALFLLVARLLFADEGVLFAHGGD